MDTAGMFDAAGHVPVFGGDEPREHVNAAVTNDVVVKAAPERHSAKLDDAKASSIGAVLRAQLLESNDAVRDALHLQVLIDSGHVIEQQRRTLAGAEELLERE